MTESQKSRSPSPFSLPEPSSYANSKEISNPRHQEIVRLIVQSLDHWGYSNSAQSLQQEAGIAAENKLITKFREAVLSGNWTDVEEILSVLANQKHHFNDPEIQFNEVKFLIRQQRFMELLESQKQNVALHVLRGELSILNIHHDRIHLLSSFIFSSDFADVKRRAGWEGSGYRSRQNLLMELQKYIPAAVMIPENRLGTVLDRYIELQQSRCLYHNTDEPISLMTDHECLRSHFPCKTSRILTEHTDEVWMVRFSNNGNFLASVAKDGRIIIWDVETWKPFHILPIQSHAPNYVAWSPDDSFILTTSSDKTVKMWDTKTGQLFYTFSKHTESTTTCAWLPDSRRFVSGGSDKQIILWNVDGTVEFIWNSRGQDLAVTHDSKYLIAVSSTKIWVYSLVDKSNVPISVMSESAGSPSTTNTTLNPHITSVFAARDCKHVLVKLSNQEVHLWDFHQRVIVKRYPTEKKEGKFVIRSCFGGLNETFILSGSEDSHVNVWHRELQINLESLSGHSKCVSSVSWNPKKAIFASGSDDNTIRIWTP